MRKLFASLILLCLFPTISAAQTPPQICTTTITPPFLVTSGAPFTVMWIVPDTTVETTTSQSVPNRVNGFYVQIDGGPKSDIGMATALGVCPSTTPYPNDLAYSYRTPAGVTRGAHTLKVSAWNFTLDGTGTPTTTKQESVVTTVNFTAGDPILFGPPAQPMPVVIIK